MNYFLSQIGLQALVEQATETTGNTGGLFGDMTGFFAFFEIIIGIFAMYSAITGKGPAFKNDYPNVMKEDANKLLRKFTWIFGPVLLATGILDYFGYTWAYYASMAIILPAIVIYIVIFRRRFNKFLKK